MFASNQATVQLWYLIRFAQKPSQIHETMQLCCFSFHFILCCLAFIDCLIAVVVRDFWTTSNAFATCQKRREKTNPTSNAFIIIIIRTFFVWSYYRGYASLAQECMHWMRRCGAAEYMCRTWYSVIPIVDSELLHRHHFFPLLFVLLNLENLMHECMIRAQRSACVTGDDFGWNCSAVDGYGYEKKKKMASKNHFQFGERKNRTTEIE